MDIHTLQYFKTICEELSFRKAAERLHISQPSLSVAMRKMEEEMDIILLHRDNKGVRITPEGALLYKEACLVLKQIEDVENRMRDMKRDAVRKLKLALPATSGAWLWPELLEGFQEENPGIELSLVDISSYDVLKGILNDEYEVGYAVLDVVKDEEIQTQVLCEDEIKLLVNAEDPLAKEEVIDIHLLEGRRFAMYNAGTSFCESAFCHCLEENDIHVDILYVRQQSSVFNLVAQGLFLGVILDDIELVRNNNLLCIRALAPSIPYRCGFLWKKHRYLSTSTKKLLEYFEH